MDLQGPGYVTYTSDGRGIDLTPQGGPAATNSTFSHLKIWNWEAGAYVVSANNTLFEYIDMYDIAPENWSVYHPNGIYTADADGLTVRYSRFHYGTHHGIGEGIFCEQGGGCANWLIYGNVFYDLNHAGWKAIEIASAATNIKVFNNTFDNVSSAFPVSGAGGSCSGDSQVRNNMVYNSSNFQGCGTMSNNLDETSPNPFINRAGKNYHIVSTIGSGYPRNAGTNPSSNFTKDRDGNTFGADGKWDIGAFEYNDLYSSGGISPTAPSGLQVK
jgi:hypothetical protein